MIKNSHLKTHINRRLYFLLFQNLCLRLCLQDLKHRFLAKFPLRWGEGGRERGFQSRAINLKRLQSIIRPGYAGSQTEKFGKSIFAINSFKSGSLCHPRIHIAWVFYIYRTRNTYTQALSNIYAYGRQSILSNR